MSKLNGNTFFYDGNGINNYKSNSMKTVSCGMCKCIFDESDLKTSTMTFELEKLGKIDSMMSLCEICSAKFELYRNK